jgi:tartrate-resistant acid phosphatase type 5
MRNLSKIVVVSVLLILFSLNICYNHYNITKPKLRHGGKNIFTFAVLGDFGTGNHKQLQVARQLSVETKRNALQLILSTGDNVYKMTGNQDDDGVSNVEDIQFKTKFEDVYGNLKIPFYLTLGNHDCGGNSTAQIYYTRYSPSKLWNMPNRYYTFERTIGNSNSKDVVKFLILDSCSLACGGSSGSNDRCKHVHFPSPNDQDQIRTKQIQWMKKLLEKPLPTKSSWIIISTHWPIFSVFGNGPTKVMIEELEPLVQEAGYRHGGRILWFNGHDHGLQHIQKDKNHYFVSGGGGYKLHPTLKSSADGAYVDEEGTMKSILNKNAHVAFKKSCHGFITVQLSNDGRGIVRFHESENGINDEANIIYQVSVP